MWCGSPPRSFFYFVVFFFRTNNFTCLANHINTKIDQKGIKYMKATGIVRRIDDLGRVVIPKEIRRTMRIREGDPLLTVLTQEHRFYAAMSALAQRLHI